MLSHFPCTGSRYTLSHADRRRKLEAGFLPKVVGGLASCTRWLVRVLTVCVHSNDEVIPHSLGLPQLVGVAVMHHVIAEMMWQENKKKSVELLITYTPLDHNRVNAFQKATPLVQQVTLTSVIMTLETQCCLYHLIKIATTKKVEVTCSAIWR